MKNKIILYKLAAIIPGILMILLGINITVSNNKFMKNNPKTTAMITDIEITYRDNHNSKHKPHENENREFLVTYTVDGETYENIKTGYYTSSRSVGDTITIYYSKDNPRYVMMEDGEYFPLILLSVMGLVFILLGVFLDKIIDSIKLSEKRNNLL